jgi:hypothetical protein
VGNFVVKAFGNGIRFQMRACGYLALCVQHVFVVDVCGQFRCKGVWKRNSVFKCAPVVIWPFVSNMLLLWTFVGKFVVKAFGNGFRFQMRTCGDLALLSNMLLLWTLVGRFVVRRLETEFRFQMRTCGDLALLCPTCYCCGRLWASLL